MEPRGVTIDCTGLAISPGFIDMHSHSDLFCMSEPQLAAKLHQGITTEVLGQDGLSEAPIPPEYIPMWRRHLSGLNGDPDLPWDWRTYGAFPRKLGHYVREVGLESLEEAVRKMTSLSAGRLGLADRGTLRSGAFADMVVFDPATIIDRATYEQPRMFPQGISHVMVNGVPAIWSGVETGRLAGRSLRK